MAKYLFLFVLMTAQVFAVKQKGPQYNDIQLAGMGNAGIASSESRHIMYLNPAGLYFMPHAISIGLPINLATGDFVFKAFDFLKKNQNTFENGTKDLTPEQYSAFYNGMRQFDRKDIILSGNLEGGLAVRYFGIGTYLNPEFRVNMDMGIFNPMFAAKSKINWVLQSDFAFGKRDKWSVGLAPKIVVLFQAQKTVAPAASMFEAKTKKTKADPFSGFDSYKLGYGGALDAGFQYRFKERHAMGIALRDLGKGFSNKGSDTLVIAPTLHMGYAWKADTTTESWWKKKTLVALDIRDLGTNSHILSKVNVGYQRTGNLLYVFDGAIRLGVQGGYPTFGLGVAFLKVFHLDYATYANELGKYPGQEMDRFHILQLQIGI
jgi:hypothetical protein